MTRNAVVGCMSDGLTKRQQIIDIIHRTNMEKEELGVSRALLPVTPTKTQVSGILYREKAKLFGEYTVHPQDLRDLRAAYGEEPEDRNEPFFLSLKMRDDEDVPYVVMVASTRNLLDFGPDSASVALDGKHNASFTEFKLLLATTLDGNGATVVKGIFTFILPVTILYLGRFFNDRSRICLWRDCNAL